MPAANPTSAQPKTTNFVSLQNYLDANQPAVQHMVGNLTGSAEQSAKTAQNEANAVANSIYGTAKQQGPGTTQDVTQTPGYGKARADQTSAWDQLRGLTNQSARTDQLNTLYGGTATGLDSTLAGVGGGEQLKAAQGQFAGLDSYLQDQSGKAQQRGWGEYKAPPQAPVVDPAKKAPNWGEGRGMNPKNNPRGSDPVEPFSGAGGENNQGPATGGGQNNPWGVLDPIGTMINPDAGVGKGKKASPFNPAGWFNP